MQPFFLRHSFENDLMVGGHLFSNVLALLLSSAQFIMQSSVPRTDFLTGLWQSWINSGISHAKSLLSVAMDLDPLKSYISTLLICIELFQSHRKMFSPKSSLAELNIHTVYKEQKVNFKHIGNRLLYK